MARIVHIRLKKWFKGCKNYIILGEVLDETSRYIKVEGRTFHFGRLSFGMGGLHQGGQGVRGIPWGSIEVVHDLPEDTDWKAKPIYSDAEDTVVLDNEQRTLIVDARITRFGDEEADSGEGLGESRGSGGAGGGALGGALPEGHLKPPGIGGI